MLFSCAVLCKVFKECVNNQQLSNGKKTKVYSKVTKPAINSVTLLL